MAVCGCVVVSGDGLLCWNAVRLFLLIGHFESKPFITQREVEMLERLVGLEKCSIQQCQRLAEKFDFDGVTFDLCGPKGKIKAQWLDAYMGLFRLEGHEGFVMTSQFEFNPDVWCENIQMPSPSAEAITRSPYDRHQD